MGCPILGPASSRLSVCSRSVSMVSDRSLQDVGDAWPIFIVVSSAEDASRAWSSDEFRVGAQYPASSMEPFCSGACSLRNIISSLAILKRDEMHGRREVWSWHRQHMTRHRSSSGSRTVQYGGVKRPSKPMITGMHPARPPRQHQGDPRGPRNAPLTPEGRRRLCQRVDAGRPVCHVAAEAGIARQTLAKWHARWLEDGENGLHDRSSRPVTCECVHHRHREGDGRDREDDHRRRDRHRQRDPCQSRGARTFSTPRAWVK